MLTQCKNCNNKFLGNYCNNCGQSAKVEKIDFKSLWEDAISIIFKYYEKGIIFSVKQLFTRPGDTIREYLEGKRVSHFKPFSLLLMFAALYGILINISGIDVFFGEESSSGLNEFGDLNNRMRWIFSNYSFAVFLTVPLFSICSYLTFNKYKYNFAEHIILNTFLACQRMVYRIATFPLLYFYNETYYSKYIIDSYIFIDFALMLWANFGFYKLRNKRNLILLTLGNYILIILGFVIILIILELLKMI
ncbi:MAG: DUF3667 domain-containing protein [Ignavibacteriaceae bacterium]